MKEAGIDFKNLILDNIREGIILLDSESNFVFMNQEAENIIGISSQRFKKDNDINLLDKQIGDLINTIKIDQKTKYINEIKIRDMFNKENIISVYVRPILNYENTPPELDYILIQFTNLEGMHLLNKKTKLDEEEELMSQLFYGLAHEIKNPLAGIKGAAQLINSQDRSSDTIKECSDIIEKEAIRLSELVNTFKHLQPHSPATFSETNINELLDEVINICSKEYDKKDVAIFISFESEAVNILCDKELLRIVLLNVVKNAYDSIDTKGEIRISTKRMKDFKLNNKNLLQINIEDSGQGIKEAEINKVFQPFYSTKKNGQGIGLFLSQKIINKFGGFIEARSKANGVVFSIYIPAN